MTAYCTIFYELELCQNCAQEKRPSKWGLWLRGGAGAHRGGGSERLPPHSLTHWESRPVTTAQQEEKEGIYVNMGQI